MPTRASPAPVTPTQQSIPWAGPLLYPPWYLHFEPAGVPIYDLGAGQTRWLQTSEPVYQILDWSPDGCQAAYLAQGEDQSEDRVRVVHLYTLEDSVLFSGPHRSWGWVRLAWSPTGEWIVYKSSGGDLGNQLYLVRPSGGESKQLTDDPYLSGIAGWVAGGQEVLYWSSFPNETAEGELWTGIQQLNIVHIDSMEERAIARYARPLESWEDLVITDVRTLRPLRVTGLPEPQGVRVVHLYWAPDLSLFLVVTARDAPEGGDALVGVNMYTFDVLRGAARKLNPREFEFIGFGSQSRDGLLFVFVGLSFDDMSAQEPRTYVLNIATGEVKVLGQEEGGAFWAPNWSPDNTMLSLIQTYGNDALDYGSYVYDMGSGKVTRLPDDFFYSGSGWSIGWSPRPLYGADACGQSR